jgi:hypothetical protein
VEDNDMDETYWAERLGDDIDAGLCDQPSAAPREYLEASEAARALAAADFSRESTQRLQLRTRLLAQPVVGADNLRSLKEVLLNAFRVRPAVFKTLTVVLALIFLLNILFPGHIASAARALQATIEQIVLGPNTTVIQVATQVPGQPRPLPSDIWVIRTDIGNFGGNVAPGQDTTVRTVLNLAEAQASFDFHLVTPAALPKGYTLREIKLAPIGGTAEAILFYSGPGHDIILAEVLGGPQVSTDPNTLITVVTGVITDGSLESTELDGRLAAWMDGHTLLWESNGISFELGGLDLNLDAAKDLARSLR